VLDVLIGAVTFTGSLIAPASCRGCHPGPADVFRGGAADQRRRSR
jgi:NAD/NADP transhydrogenase beta subunit